jgi:bifunctional non-homologous end joining protein LigD
MRDQLSLRLEPDVPPLPNLPEGLRPMLPRALADPFDSATHIFEPAWGGLRALAYVGPAASPGAGEVRVVDADGRDVGARLPELAGMAVRLDARSAVLDGELVAVDGSGRADPAELARRIRGETGRPVAYLAFDLLHLDGRSLLSMPLHKRRDLLRRVLHPGDEVLAVPAIAAEGRALHEAAAAQGIAGVLARQRTSPYLPGTKSRLWRFVAALPAKTPEAVATSPTETRAAETSRREADGDSMADATAAAPVMALISRLPLPFDD